MNPNSSTPSPSPPSPEASAASADTQALFREIAKETHPDKQASEDPTEQGRREKLFREAKEHVENGDWVALSQIARSLGIDVGAPTKDQVTRLLELVADLRQKIQTAKRTPAWHWFTLDTQGREDFMRTYYAEVLGI